MAEKQMCEQPDCPNRSCWLIMFKDHHGEEKYTYSCGSHLHNRLAYFALVKKRVFSVKAIKKPRFVLLGRKTRNKLNEEYKQMGLEFVKF